MRGSDSGPIAAGSGQRAAGRNADPSLPVACCPLPARTVGFTVVELVLVLAILATMAAVAVPRFAGARSRYRAELAAHRLAGELELARQAARAGSGTATVTFNIATARVTVTRPNGSTRTTCFRDAPFGATLNSVSLSGGGTTLRINGYGIASGRADIRLRVGSTEGRVTIDDAGIAVRVE